MSVKHKVLQNLIDSMHKLIAAGHGEKSVNVSSALDKASSEEKNEQPNPKGMLSPDIAPKPKHRIAFTVMPIRKPLDMSMSAGIEMKGKKKK